MNQIILCVSTCGEERYSIFVHMIPGLFVHIFFFLPEDKGYACAHSVLQEKEGGFTSVSR
jgi:hypothetical protein